MGIFVAGMHRSGTSSVASLLHHMGAFTGDECELLGADAFNAAGYWERVDVFQLHERMLQSADAAWDRVREFALDAVPPSEIEYFDRRARAIISRLGSHATWAIKDPRLCFLFPLWRRLVPRPVCVLVHRHPLQVAASLQLRNGFAPSFALALWERYTLASLAATHGVPRILASYDRLLADPSRESRRLQQQLGALGCAGLHPPAPEQAERIIQASLCHARTPGADIGAELTDAQLALHQLLDTGRAMDHCHIPAMSADGLAALERGEQPVVPSP